MQLEPSIERFAREELKLRLAMCTDAEQRIYKQMYSHLEPFVDINKAVDNTPPSKLNWALTQVNATLAKRGL